MAQFLTAFFGIMTSGITGMITAMGAGLEAAVGIVWDSESASLTAAGGFVIAISSIAIGAGLVWLFLGLVKHRR